MKVENIWACRVHQREPWVAAQERVASVRSRKNQGEGGFLAGTRDLGQKLTHKIGVCHSSESQEKEFILCAIGSFGRI